MGHVYMSSRIFRDEESCNHMFRATKLDYCQHIICSLLSTLSSGPTYYYRMEAHSIVIEATNCV